MKKRQLNKIIVMLICSVFVLMSAASCGTGSNDNTKADTGNTSSPASTSTSTPASSSASTSPDASSEQGTSTGSTRDTLNIALASDSGTLSPVSIGGDFFSVPLTMMEPLWDVTENNDYIWLLAESVEEVSPTQWIVHLRQNVKFSNGNPFTVDDVLFTIQLTRDSGSIASPRTQSIDIEATKAIDDYTLDLRFIDYHVSNMTIIGDMLIYDEESYEAEKASAEPIGTGPYILTEYIVNSHCFVERRDDYWGETPAIQYLKFRVLAETSQVVNALETGNVDVGRIAPQDFDYVSELTGFSVLSRYAATWASMGFNVTEDSIMHNVEARYAICHAINRQAMISLVYNGMATMMYNPITAVAFDYEPRFDNLHETYSIGFDAERAKQLAESSGLIGKEVRIITNGTAEFVTMAEIIQGMLKDIGVNAAINNYDPATFSQLSSDPTTYDLRLSGGICPNRRVSDPIVNGVRYSKILSAPGSWEDVEEYLELAPKSFHTPDAQERSDVTLKLLQMYTKACLTYPICDVLTSIAHSVDLKEPIVYRAAGGIRYADVSYK